LWNSLKFLITVTTAKNAPAFSLSLWNTLFFYIIHENLVSTSQKRHCLCVTTTNRLILNVKLPCASLIKHYAMETYGGPRH
jgi:hypothetical protein